MSLFFKELPRCTPADQPALEAGFFGLVQGLMSGALRSLAEESVTSARVAAMKAYIDRNLAEPTLGVDSLLAVFGAARTTAFRDFAEHGGIRNYITDQRLQRAYADLAGRQGRPGGVGAVAEAWGFRSVSHFSRLFRSRFGVPPGDVVGADIVRAAASPSVVPMYDRSVPDPHNLSRVYERIVQNWG